MPRSCGWQPRPCGSKLGSVSIVFDLTEVETSRVTVRSSELAELMAMLHCLAEPGHHLDLGRDLKAVEASAPASLRRQLRAFAPLWARFRLRALMPLDARADAGFSSELACVARLPLDTFVAMAVEAITGGRVEPRIDVLAGDSDRARFLEVCRARSEEREELGARLIQNPELFRENLLGFLGDCHSVFFNVRWEAVIGRIRQGETEVRRRLEVDDAAVVLASLTPGAHHFPQISQVVYDKLQNAFVDGRGRDFVLIPSVMTRPHVIVKFDQGYPSRDVPVIVQFPVSEMDSRATSLAQIQQRMAVLAEGARLELCRHLVNEYCSTSELARRTGMGAPQVSRHLGRLREVGLLESVRDGKMVRHRMQLAAVYSLGYEFLARIIR